MAPITNEELAKQNKREKASSVTKSILKKNDLSNGPSFERIQDDHFNTVECDTDKNILARSDAEKTKFSYATLHRQVEGREAITKSGDKLVTKYERSKEREEDLKRDIEYLKSQGLTEERVKEFKEWPATTSRVSEISEEELQNRKKEGYVTPDHEKANVAKAVETEFKNFQRDRRNEESATQFVDRVRKVKFKDSPDVKTFDTHLSSSKAVTTKGPSRTDDGMRR